MKDTNKPLRILIACEYSGTVRDAFIAKGHHAVSCDLLPTDKPGPHYMGSVLDILHRGWDMMIAHPPCTYLTNAGIGYFNEERWGNKAAERARKRDEAMEFFMQLYHAPISRVCIENPVGWPNSQFREPDQVIHPYYFGEPHKKRTCLWLRGLPLLRYSADIIEPEPLSVQIRKPGKHYAGGEIKKRYFTDVYGGSAKSAHIRSKTFQSIANAMADQWGDIELLNKRTPPVQQTIFPVNP